MEKKEIDKRATKAKEKYKEKEQEAKSVVDAWRMLYYNGLLSDKENESINKKINTRYGKYLFPTKFNPTNTK